MLVQTKHVDLYIHIFLAQGIRMHLLQSIIKSIGGQERTIFFQPKMLQGTFPIAFNFQDFFNNGQSTATYCK